MSIASPFPHRLLRVSPRRVVQSWISKAAVCAMISCSSNEPSGTSADDPGAGAASPQLTWEHDVRAVVESKCSGCHVKGGFAPFALQSYADAHAHRSLIASAIESKTMPPWPPNNTCNTYEHDRSLTDQERQTIVTWARGGALQGDALTYLAPKSTPAPTLRADKSIAPDAAYTPVAAPDAADEYRCFVLDWNETITKYVTGLRVRPGNTPEVHHAIAFLIKPADVAAITALDSADPGTGYKCFGGPGVNGAGWLGAWVPGSLGDVFPKGTGIAVPTGAKIVLQMHYNTGSAPAAPDQSTIDLQLADQVEKEAATLKFSNPSWVKNKTMLIKAGDADSVQRFTFAPSNFMTQISGGVLKPGAPFTIWSTALHMHARGVSATLKVIHADGTTDCGLEIDDWNFHWQGSYRLAKPITFQPGDQLSIECHYDNSGARQPLVGGEPLAVTDVHWGETTEDEMCLGIMYATP
jgi:hypothetical protein